MALKPSIKDTNIRGKVTFEIEFQASLRSLK